MNFEGLVFEDFQGHDSKRLWELRIPLTDEQHVNFFRELEGETSSIVLSAFATAVEHGMRTCMERRLHEAATGRPAEVIKMPPIVKRYYAASAAAAGGANRNRSAS
jgi:hypothetical protein